MNGDLKTTGASSVASTKPPPFLTLTSARASPFSQAPTGTKNAMAAPPFPAQSQAFRPAVTSHLAYPLPLTAVHPFDRDATMSAVSPFAPAPSALSSVLIRRLPLNTTEESLRLMLVFSQEVVDVEVVPVERSEDSGFRSAILKFKTLAGAQEAKTMLDGKSNISNDAEMIVEILGGSPASGRRHLADGSVPAGTSTGASSAASSATSSRQSTRFNGAPLNGTFGSELANSDASSHYQTIFSPQSPIGNHLTERPRISGKTLINNDAADDETGELLKDPVAYAESENGGAPLHPRRATAPHIPVSRMAALSLNGTAATGSGSMPAYGPGGMGLSLSAHANTMSPSAMNGAGPAVNFNHHYRGHNFPPVNPADQNPPCNTLYVGNLPIDTSEEELKAMFSKQRGYKRLCFRTKQNGPMCFVEFEDVSFATKALHELYGHPLHNSVKGGIRLSFSKNPLGVRSGQNPGQNPTGSVGTMTGMMSASTNGFTSASGPPPGLAAPPGLGLNRMGYGGASSLAGGGSSTYNDGAYLSNANNPWNDAVYNGAMTAGGPSSMMASTSSAFQSSYMMGR